MQVIELVSTENVLSEALFPPNLYVAGRSLPKEKHEVKGRRLIPSPTSATEHVSVSLSSCALSMVYMGQAEGMP